MPIRVLLDRNLRDHALRARPAGRLQTIRWGDTDVSAKIAGIMGKPLPPPGWLREQVLCLPTVASLARQGRLAMFSCTEIGFEEASATMPFRSQYGDIFAGVTIDELESAVERSYFYQTIDFSKHISGDYVAEFIRDFLLKLDESKSVPLIREHAKVPEFFLRNLENVERFRELCKGLTTSDHLRDAFHLWTAEVHGLDYFLTADQGFINVMTQTKRVNLPTRPICPTQLLEVVGVPRLDPMPLAADEYRDWIDSIFADPPAKPIWQRWLDSMYRSARIAWFRAQRATARLWPSARAVRRRRKR
jgi:predicted nucleic acid-binding protein